MAKTDEIINVPVADIEETQNNEYIFGIDESDVNRLAEEIKDHGFIGSIDVVDLHNGKYQVFAGHQRLRAVKKLGWETVPCTVAEDMTEEELYRKLLASNVLNRKISPLGYARAIDAYKKEVLAKEKPAGRTRTLCAKFFNVAEGQVQRYEAILKTTPYVQELCRTGELPYAPLAEATSFTPEQQEELEQKIRSFKSRNQGISLSMNLLSGMINDIKESQRRAEAREQLQKAQATLAKRLDEQEKKEREEEKESALQSYYESAQEVFTDPFEGAMVAPQEEVPVQEELPIIPPSEIKAQPVVARTPAFSEDEAERLEKSSSIAGTPISVFGGFDGDELDDDEEEAVPSWGGSPVISPTESAVLQAVDDLVSAVSAGGAITDTDAVRVAVRRAEEAIAAIKEKIGM